MNKTLMAPENTVEAVLKPDLESRDDQKLAVAELRALTASRRHKSLDHHRIFLASRLAFWSEVRSADGASTITQSQILEDTATTGNRKDEVSNRPINFDAPSPNIRKKNDYLSHAFHKYKAKFFPRLARSLINIVAPDEGALIVDPFVGSGTTCVEASLMGVRSAGFDIDPLSVLIAELKTNAYKIDLAKAKAALSHLPTDRSWQAPPSISSHALHQFKLPTFLLARSPRRLPPELARQVEDHVNLLLGAIAAVDDIWTKKLLEVILSHAISTKISLRWMGTGDDRFALEVASRSVLQIFSTHAKSVFRNLEVYGHLKSENSIVEFAPSSIKVSNASSLPIEDTSVDGIVTSPPYLPASSGRETYLRSRASSILALGLMDEAEILKTERDMLGSILAAPRRGGASVPQSVFDLADWMRPQRERTAKADPTIAYFESLRNCFAEAKRVLKPGAKAAFVVSKEHTFWASGSGEVLRRFDMAKAVEELATSPSMGIGLNHVETIDLELPKMDFVARPGSKGKYSEAVVILER